MMLRSLFIVVALLFALPGLGLATHIHYENYASDASVVASFSTTDDSWSHTFKLTENLMPLWDVEATTPLADGSFDLADSFGNGSYDPSGSLHYVYLRIDPNNYPPEGNPTSSYIKLTVNGIDVDSWSDPILLYDWGVPGDLLSDPYGISTENKFEITVALTGLAKLSELLSYSSGNGNGNEVENKLPLEITNVNLEGCFEKVSPVPEPSTLLLLGSGILGLAVWSRRKR